KALLVTGIDAIGDGLTAPWIRRPAKGAKILLTVVLERNIQRRRWSARRKAPGLTPIAPDSLSILGANMPVIFAIRIQLAGGLERVASRTGVAGAGDQFGKAHGERPLHIGAGGELEVIVGDL